MAAQVGSPEFVFLKDEKFFAEDLTKVPASTFKHFVIVRFFPKQDPRYPYDVLDVDFLANQLVLAKENCLKSLENQTNKNFELIFLMNPAYYSDEKYKFVFKTLKASTKLPIRFVVRGKFAPLAREAFAKYDFVIESRIDFDDFIFKDGIADTQNKIAECDSVLCYGYCTGYMYFDGRLYNFKSLHDGNGHPSVLQSLIYKSSFANNLPIFTPYSCFHTKVKKKLREFLQKNGVAFLEKMFQQNDSTKAFIYFRHDLSHNTFVNNMSPEKVIEGYDLLSNDKLTKKQLEKEFAFHYELK